MRAFVLPFAVSDFLHIFPSVDLAQQSDGLLRLLQGLDLVVNDQRNFRDLLDLEEKRDREMDAKTKPRRSLI